MAHMPDIARLLFKRLRIAQRLSRRELAKRAKTDPSYITLIERDGYTPSREKSIALAEVLSNGGGARRRGGLLAHALRVRAAQPDRGATLAPHRDPAGHQELSTGPRPSGQGAEERAGSGRPVGRERHA